MAGIIKVLSYRILICNRVQGGAALTLSVQQMTELSVDKGPSVRGGDKHIPSSELVAFAKNYSFSCQHLFFSLSQGSTPLILYPLQNVVCNTPPRERLKHSKCSKHAEQKTTVPLPAPSCADHHSELKALFYMQCCCFQITLGQIYSSAEYNCNIYTPIITLYCFGLSLKIPVEHRNERPI